MGTEQWQLDTPLSAFSLCCAAVVHACCNARAWSIPASADTNTTVKTHPPESLQLTIECSTRVRRFSKSSHRYYFSHNVICAFWKSPHSGTDLVDKQSSPCLQKVNYKPCHLPTPSLFSGWSNAISPLTFLLACASFQHDSPCRMKNTVLVTVWLGSSPVSKKEAQAERFWTSHMSALYFYISHTHNSDTFVVHNCVVQNDDALTYMRNRLFKRGRFALDSHQWVVRVHPYTTTPSILITRMRNFAKSTHSTVRAMSSKCILNGFSHTHK